MLTCYHSWSIGSTFITRETQWRQYKRRSKVSILSRATVGRQSKGSAREDSKTQNPIPDPVRMVCPRYRLYYAMRRKRALKM